MQLKQRKVPTEKAETEERWFKSKVLGKATKQIRDTLQYLDENHEIELRNQRGHTFAIRQSELSDIVKVVVYLGGEALPSKCREKQFHISSTAGYIHIIPAHDYLGIIETLIVPEDIRRYFEYREQVTQKLAETAISVGEQDIMGAFLNDEKIPNPDSKNILSRLVQDFEEFNISGLIGNLHSNIELAQNPDEYYKIMLEFARVPRSVWREIKLRFMRCLEAAKNGTFEIPFRFSFPATDCAFMIASLDPNMNAVGEDGQQNRINGIINLTDAAMYDVKASKGIGIQISKDGEYILIDWTLIELEWAPNEEMDEKFRTGSPFREAREKTVDSFYLRN